MFRYRAFPYLTTLSGSAIHSDWVRLYGIGESAMEAILRPVMETAQNPSLAPYAKEGECLVRITARAGTDEEAAAMNAPYVRKVCETLAEYVYGVNVGSLEEVVVHRFAERGMTLACAESCTERDILLKRDYGARNLEPLFHKFICLAAKVLICRTVQRNAALGKDKAL